VTYQTGSIAGSDLIEEQIKLVLDIVPVEIHLEILPGHIPATGGRPLPRPLHLISPKEDPLNGASIGIQGNRDRAGTLDGWVILNLPKQGKEVPCAMTCHPVVSVGNNSRADDSSFADNNTITGGNSKEIDKSIIDDKRTTE